MCRQARIERKSAIDESIERGELAAIEEQSLAAGTPVVFDIARALERDHVLTALVAARGRRAVHVRLLHAALDHRAESERVDHLLLAFIEDDSTASRAPI